MRTGITVSWIANVNPCDTPIPSDVLIAGVRQCLGSYSRTIPNTKSPLVPGIEMNSMLCPPVQTRINCIRFTLQLGSVTAIPFIPKSHSVCTSCSVIDTSPHVR
ncbi:hypothetical protein M9H77_06408 [Catharanthus roseus]|uniref:Uncharacterized protein n=1 Tax=Catharanthus roseus TaxID=4058 RepID=A0ACC0BS15_CATRO|nr:hypothetical protein M9H77_06408 [Catharanthus roseus]